MGITLDISNLSYIQLADMAAVGLDEEAERTRDEDGHERRVVADEMADSIRRLIGEHEAMKRRLVGRPDWRCMKCGHYADGSGQWPCPTCGTWHYWESVGDHNWNPESEQGKAWLEKRMAAFDEWLAKAAAPLIKPAPKSIRVLAAELATKCGCFFTEDHTLTGDRYRIHYPSHDVRNGARVVTSHAQICREMKAYAKRMGIGLEAPPAETEGHPDGK